MFLMIRAGTWIRTTNPDYEIVNMGLVQRLFEEPLPIGSKFWGQFPDNTQVIIFESPSPPIVNNFRVGVDDEFSVNDFEGDPPPPDPPGEECAGALTINIGQEYGPFNLSSGTGHWFKAAHTGGDYKVSVDITAVSGEVNIFTYTGVCGDQVTDISGILVEGANCNSSTQDEQDVYIQLTAGTSATYTITFALGTCE